MILYFRGKWNSINFLFFTQSSEMFPPPSKGRQYRGKDIETPSRTPGINTDWKERDHRERGDRRRENGGITMKSTQFELKYQLHE